MIGKLKERVRRLLPKNKFARSVTVLVGGTVSSQILLVLASPVLTRLYTPEDFGLVAIYSSLLGFVAVIASLRYELAIPLPRDDLDAAHVVVVSLLAVVVVVVLASCFVILMGGLICEQLSVPMLADYLWLLPVGAGGAGIYKVFSYWAIRTKNFLAISHTKLWQSMATLTIQLLAFKAGGIALIVGQAGGHGVGSFSLARKTLILPEFKRITWEGLKKIAVRYRRFPIFSSLEGLANTAGFQLPPLMFAFFFGASATGLYSLADRVLSIPITLISGSVGQVFYSRAAEVHRTGDAGELVAILHENLAHIAMPLVVMLIIVGPDFFAMFFGENWRQAGEFSRWMSPWLYFVFVSSPLSTVFSLMEKQVSGMTFQIILLVSRIGAISLGGYYNDVLLTVMLFSCVSALCWAGFLVWVFCLSGKKIRAIVNPTLMASLFSILCNSPLIICVIFGFPFVGCFFLAFLFVLVRYVFLFKRVYS